MLPSIHCQHRAVDSQQHEAPIIDFNSTSICLRKRTLTPAILENLCKVLVTSAVLRELDVSDNPLLGDEGMKHIAFLIERHPNIRKLGLARTGITRWGVELLYLAYNAHRAVEEVDLSGNKGVDDHACVELSKWLRLHNTNPVARNTPSPSTPAAQQPAHHHHGEGLRSLCLLDTRVGPQGAVLLMEGAAECPSLVSLRLPFHVGKGVHDAAEEMLSERRRAAEEKVREEVMTRQMVYGGQCYRQGNGGGGGLSDSWRSRPPTLSSPRLASTQTWGDATPRHIPGVLEGSVSDWGGGISRGSLMCLSLLEAKGAQQSAARMERREAEMLMSAASNPPLRGQRHRTLAPLSPRSQQPTANSAVSARLTTLGSYLVQHATCGV